MSSLAPLPRALLTDVFGTVVNWRRTVTTHLEASASRALDEKKKEQSYVAADLVSAVRRVSWPAFAQAWRKAYYHFCRSYDAESKAPFEPIDAFFRRSLGDLVRENGVVGLWTEEEMDEIARVWYRLEPWEDSAPGLAMLTGAGFTTSTLSNGNRKLLRDLAEFGGLQYSQILSAEDFGAYKPSQKVYLGAVERLKLQPGECAMVAAHLGDLEAAKGCGLRTVYVERAEEEEWDGKKVQEARAEGWVDLWIGLEEDRGCGKGGFVELARRFGAERK